MIARTYATPEAFKQALEQRLRTSSRSGADMARKRQLLVFERFLARVVSVLGTAVTLKGGLVLELRLKRARTTKDVDLRVMGTPDNILETLKKIAESDLPDFMTFQVVPDEDYPVIQNDGTKYEGLRFRAECRLAGKLYGQSFGVDIAFGEPMLGEPDQVAAADILAFAGIAAPALRLYPLETHIAEKLHAYTMPRPRPNSRVKDLPDIALLATARSMDAPRLRAALEQTFAYRQTHALPAELPNPPSSWTIPYETMARDDQLQWPTLEAVTQAAKTFLDPVLRRQIDATWEPESWTWRLH